MKQKSEILSVCKRILIGIDIIILTCWTLMLVPFVVIVSWPCRGFVFLGITLFLTWLLYRPKKKYVWVIIVQFAVWAHSCIAFSFVCAIPYFLDAATPDAYYIAITLLATGAVFGFIKLYQFSFYKRPLLTANLVPVVMIGLFICFLISHAIIQGYQLKYQEGITSEHEYSYLIRIINDSDEGFINEYQEEIIPCQFEDIEGYGMTKDGFRILAYKGYGQDDVEYFLMDQYGREHSFAYCFEKSLWMLFFCAKRRRKKRMTKIDMQKISLM